MKTNVKTFHEDCIQACCQCPQCYELNLPEVEELGSPLGVITYWTSCDTDGGRLLNIMGYDEELTEESKDILRKADKEIEKALSRVFGKK